MNHSKVVLTYRDTLLAPSETFVRSQAESLKSFTSHYLCLRRVSGPPLPEDRVHRLCRMSMVGRVQRAFFHLFGPTKSQCDSLAKCSPLLLHAHFAPDGADVLPLARALHLPLVVSLHGYDVTSGDEDLTLRYRRRRKVLQDSAARLLCVSRFVYERAIAAGFPAERTSVHYTGIDTTFFAPDTSVERMPLVLFVGRLVEGKGCEYLIRAMASVQKKFPEVGLVIIGNGPLRRPLEQLAGKTLQGFSFLGAQPSHTVRYWMNRAKVFCTPSVKAGCAEGFGMVFGEAQAMGLPVVSTEVGGIPEVVSDGETGFLVPERNSEALSKGILALLQDPVLWARMSHAGRLRVMSRFDLGKQTSLLEGIYNQVLAEWATNPSVQAAREFTPDGQRLSPPFQAIQNRREVLDES